MIRVFDIHARDIISQQNNFIRLEFLLELAFQILFANKPALDKPRYERSCSRKRIDNVHVFVTKFTAKFLTQNVIHAMENKIDTFHRRIDNA